MSKRISSILIIVALLFTIALPCAQDSWSATDTYKFVAAGENSSFAISSDGTLWAWGNNDYGKLGDGTRQSRLIPVKILVDATTVAAGLDHGLAIKSDGSLWAWGRNYTGQVGDGTNIGRSRPCKIMENATAVAAGANHSLAITKDGSLWAWGHNADGQLGDGTLTTLSDGEIVVDNNKSKPVKIMDNVVDVATGRNSSLAVKKDGSLWIWGGIVDSTGVVWETRKTSKPEKVMDDVTAVAASVSNYYAIKKNGSLWMGPLLNNGSSVPVKIMDNVVSIVSGNVHGFAIKKDGSLWAWGSNNNGELGDGTRTSKNQDSPIKIMDGAVIAACGWNPYSLAVKKDGSLWSWGNNDVGQLGNNSYLRESSPVNISGSKNLKEAAPVPPMQSVSSGMMRIFIDGHKLEDTVLNIENGRIMLSPGLIAVCFGADVKWDSKTKSVTMTRAATTVVATAGSNIAMVNGKEKILEVTPKWRASGSMHLPLRFMLDTFSQKIEWDAENRIAYISEDMTFAEKSNLDEWLLGVGAIIARVNEGAGRDPYLFAMMPRNYDNVKAQRESLAGSWGVSDRKSLLAAIKSMESAGHSYAFDQDVALFKSMTLVEQNRVLKNAQGADKYMWPYVMALDKKWGKKSIRSWDWFRVGHLCRWGYLAGYITAQEALDLFEPTAKNLRLTFNSWDEATENYLDGYAYWARIDVSDKASDFVGRNTIYEDLKFEEKTEPRGLLFDPKVWTAPVI